MGHSVYVILFYFIFLPLELLQHEVWYLKIEGTMDYEIGYEILFWQNDVIDLSKMFCINMYWVKE